MCFLIVTVALVCMSGNRTKLESSSLIPCCHQTTGRSEIKTSAVVKVSHMIHLLDTLLGAVSLFS